jgi:hypothetical protein
MTEHLQYYVVRKGKHKKTYVVTTSANNLDPMSTGSINVRIGCDGKRHAVGIGNQAMHSAFKVEDAEHRFTCCICRYMQVLKFTISCMMIRAVCVLLVQRLKAIIIDRQRYFIVHVRLAMLYNDVHECQRMDRSSLMTQLHGRHVQIRRRRHFKKLFDLIYRFELQLYHMANFLSHVCIVDMNRE